MIHRCKTHGRKFCVRCVVFTLGFPVEHVLWEKFPVLSSVTHLLGL
jgi:hypothetical protein